MAFLPGMLLAMMLATSTERTVFATASFVGLQTSVHRPLPGRRSRLWNSSTSSRRRLDDEASNRRLRLWVLASQKRTTASTDEAPVKEEATRNTKDAVTALKALDRCTSATQAQRVLQDYFFADNDDDRTTKNAVSSSSPPLYQSVQIPPGASTRPISDGDLAIQTRLVNKKYAILDLIDLSGNRDADRASLAVLTTFLSSTVAAVAANQNLPGPEIVRFLVVWILTFAPLALVGYGLKDADGLQMLLVQVQRQLLPRYRKRMVQHEAGHFLMAHLLGYPIAGYEANAVKNAVSFYPLADVDRGQSAANLLGFDPPKVRLADWIAVALNDDKPFFSQEGSGGTMVQEQSVFRDVGKRNYTAFAKLLPSANDPSKAWPYRGFDEATLDKLSVVSVAGVCAEIIAFGNAEGGLADFGQLRQFFAAADREMTEREMENRIRFALGYTMSQLRRHLGALDALAQAMERDASVAECVVEIEECTDTGGPIDYERQRRLNFRNEGTIENLLLGGRVDSDVWEDRYVEGKGGGSKKQVIRLSGDDPLYLAIAIAVGFLLWATAGGLSLH